MSRSVSFHEAAEDELIEAASFYDLENEILTNFLFGCSVN